jgi:cardiolipin synthase
MPSNILTVPNLLTFLRMALIPVFAIMLFYGHSGWALLIFFVAGASDGVDGFVARRFNQQSELAFVILTLPNVFPPIRHLPVPFWVTASVIGRDVLITASAIAIFIITDFRGFQPSWLGKLSTLVQVTAVGLILLAAIFPALNIYLPTVYTTVVAIAVFSGVHYIFYVARLMNEQPKKINL